MPGPFRMPREGEKNRTGPWRVQDAHKGDRGREKDIAVPPAFGHVRCCPALQGKRRPGSGSQRPQKEGKQDLGTVPNVHGSLPGRTEQGMNGSGEEQE